MATLLSGATAQIPVSLLTGFLGSGKTTLLNTLVRDPRMSRALVIINEFGSIGIDHDLIAASKEEVVVEMSSGCLCCTIRGDLVRTLRDAPWRFARDGLCWFDRVVIETTGLADPVPILHTLMTDEQIASLYRLDGVITTVDAATGMATLDRQDEAVRQAAVADRLVLTKSDLVSPADLERMERRVRAINPAAPLIHVVQGAVDPAVLFDAALYDPAARGEDVQAWLNAEAYASGHHHHGHHHGHDHAHEHHHHDINRHDDHIRSVCLTFEEPLDGEGVERWLDTLMMFASQDILRVKAILNLAGEAGPMVLHGVQHVFHPPMRLQAWPSEDRRSRIVFITRDLDEEALRSTLGLLTRTLTRFSIYGPEGSALAGMSPQLQPLPSGDGGGLFDLAR
ncbi:CobW family GTP-binding protein [Novosphingobium terrae]|uniref:CobW family GTP-binding protein n=1 Tax=Novosphingobium terrae TaxID=2726189 RepID=UPI00197E491D|nr:GTP-binding protein [Novosphingobium terrae]